MGCGAVCGTTTSKSSKHNNHSKHALNQLVSQININPPLLYETTFNRFSTSLKNAAQEYILPVSNYVGSDEQFPGGIKQKWKIVVFGLFKNDEVYKSCLGFSLRNQEQQLTVCDNKVERSRVLTNNSYHQVKPITQYHSCFQQIQKDLNRTFEFKQETRALFQRVLKKISNHFPGMGYTQGVNFVVGFLLILGYSQADTYWMFVHLAINKKYLLLGLYEDDFPLAAVYTFLFKNILKRFDKQLYSHFYEVIMLQDSVWIFKWFITYFIYSFPLQTIKFVWDLTIQLGGIGLVFYAVSLVLHLKSQLINLNDACDISEFLQSLKQLQNFNKYLKINQVLQTAYQIKLRKQDFDGINDIKDSFYKEYFKLLSLGLNEQKNTNFNDSTAESAFIKGQEINKKLHLWYNKLIEERYQFLMKSEEEKNRKMIVPQMLREDYEDLEKSIKLLEQKIVENESMKFTKRVIEEMANSQLLENGSNQLTIQPQEPPKKQTSLETQMCRPRVNTKPSYDIEEEIGQMEGQSDSNDDQLYISQQFIGSRNDSHPSQEFSINVQPEQASKQKQKPSQGVKISMFISQIEAIRKKTVKDGVAKANHIKIVVPELRSGLGLAGQNILNNFSITNSQYSSNQSKNAAVKPRKHKQNNLSKYNLNKISKVRTDMVSQVSQPSNSSQHESSLDHRTQKDSLSGFSHRQMKKQRFGANDLDYIDRKTQQELMITSHIAQPIKNNDLSKQMVSEIELFNGEGLFKKKKRSNNRNSALSNMMQEFSIPLRTESTANIKLQLKNHRAYNEEESSESIIELSTLRQNKKGVNHLEELLCEIESVK